MLSNKIDALAQLFQEHKNLKQPICSVKPVLTGEWVSVNFQSDAASPGGERPLRKVLRYRDQTAAPLETHLAHWESFAWDAGPVIVISKNLSWGTQQVWAASVAEGKRVLSHAAQAAGVDLTDPKHEWIVTGSNDPRYGSTGRMRLDTRGGKFMRVTSRRASPACPPDLPPTHKSRRVDPGGFSARIVETHQPYGVRSKSQRDHSQLLRRLHRDDPRPGRGDLRRSESRA